MTFQDDGDVYKRFGLGGSLCFPAEIEKPLAFATATSSLKIKFEHITKPKTQVKFQLHIAYFVLKPSETKW